jgi:hypothetical protein
MKMPFRGFNAILYKEFLVVLRAPLMQRVLADGKAAFLVSCRPVRSLLAASPLVCID